MATSEISMDSRMEVFISNVRNDPRIAPSHISLFVAIIQYAKEHDIVNPLIMPKGELMNLAKISCEGTYHKNIRQLHEYGYIRYVPSFNRFEGSKIFLL